VKVSVRVKVEAIRKSASCREVRPGDGKSGIEGREGAPAQRRLEKADVFIIAITSWHDGCFLIIIIATIIT